MIEVDRERHIRWLIRRDMPEVIEIERLTSPFPWTEEQFMSYLRHMGCIGMVVEGPEPEYRIMGFVFYEMHSPEIIVTALAVHPDYQRRGIGGEVVAKLISKLSTRNRTHVTVQVRETNLSAQLFLREMGFQAISVMRSDYNDSGEDGILMQYCLPERVQVR